MMPDNIEIVAVAATEATNPTFGTTKQFLKVHSVALEDGKPKVMGITISPTDQLPTIVYFAVEDEEFFLAVSVSPVSLSVEYAWVEDYHRISFHATSETLDVGQLSALTSLQPTESISKGDNRGNGRRKWKYHSIEFEPNPEPNPFETKIEQLLTFLEQDATGTRALVDQAEGYIRVISVFYNGNTLLGGISFDKDTVRRMAPLNLAVNFDLNAQGNFYR
jgi:hypothetical protein